ERHRQTLCIHVMHAGGELRAEGNLMSNERPLWSKADITALLINVRFTPESGHPLKALEKTLGAPLFTRLVDDGSWRACPLSNAASKVCNVPLQLIECEPNRE